MSRKKKIYRNAGISLTAEEIRMADELARQRHLSGRTALVRQMLWQAWERTFSQPRPDVTVEEAQAAAEAVCPTQLADDDDEMPLADALETVKRVAKRYEA